MLVLRQRVGQRAGGGAAGSPTHLKGRGNGAKDDREPARESHDGGPWAS